MVLDDEKFNSTTSILSKHFGTALATVLKGKLTRKLGSAAVISLSDVEMCKGAIHLQPNDAQQNFIYRVHPLDRSRYILVSQFHETLLNEKREEFCRLLKRVGCKSISWRLHPEWNRTFDAPDCSLFAEINKLDQIDLGNFVKQSSTWQRALHERLRSYCTLLYVDFSYEMSYNVRDAIIDKVYSKMGLGYREKDALLKRPGIPINSSRSQELLESDEVYKLFS